MKNTIIIMTSNIWSQYIHEISDHAEREKKVKEELRTYFRIEFLNRIDDIVLFESLKKEDINHIIELLLSDIDKRLQEKNIHVIWDENLKSYISEHGYDSELWARPLKRAINEYILNPLSRMILEWVIESGETYRAIMNKEHMLEIQKNPSS